MITKFCCCGLREGIITYSIISWILTVLYLIKDAIIASNECENENCTYALLSGLGSFILSTIICICLLLGAYKRSRGLLLPYLILQGLALAILVILGFTLMFVATEFLILIPGLALGCYFWVCVYYYYQYLHPSHPLYLQYSGENQKAPPEYSVYDVEALKN